MGDTGSNWGGEKEENPEKEKTSCGTARNNPEVSRVRVYKGLRLPAEPGPILVKGARLKEKSNTFNQKLGNIARNESAETWN